MIAIRIWAALDARARAEALARPTRAASARRSDEVRRLIAMVRADGDAAIAALTRRFDGVERGDSRVSVPEIDAAIATLATAVRTAIERSWQRINAFHAAQRRAPLTVETAPGLVCQRVVRPIRRVGLYVPAGSAPLPSTALMLGVPAALAGCDEVLLCSPPTPNGIPDAAVLYAAQRSSITRVHAVGGVQAIAAMAYGTASIPKCDKIFGPGNAWVTEAKAQVAADPEGAAIDMPAGPSEVMVIADAEADPRFVAADLLSQAEHGADSQVVLASTSAPLVERVLAELERQLATLPRAETARSALASSRAFLVGALDEAIEIANAYAPEHLILACADAAERVDQVATAGSVFVGAWTPESLGDYTSGTNHVLPTDGHARAWSGLSLDSFQRTMTVQSASAAALADVGPDAIALANAEGLVAHARAVEVRLAAIGVGR